MLILGLVSTHIVTFDIGSVSNAMVYCGYIGCIQVQSNGLYTTFVDSERYALVHEIEKNTILGRENVFHKLDLVHKHPSCNVTADDFNLTSKHCGREVIIGTSSVCCVCWHCFPHVLSYRVVSIPGCIPLHKCRTTKMLESLST